MDTQEINNSFVQDNLPEEVEIIGISFRGSTKVYYFAANGNVAKEGDNAIVETARGMEYGKVTLLNTLVKRETLVLPLKNVIRIADRNDDLRYEANREREKDAFEICVKKIAEHKLDMKLIDVEYTFDNTKLLFYFTSDDRVDFRELVKDLASYFRTRIELRQIGIRDEAKIMGGLGICGRPFCCNTFLPDFVQVSIKMAKEQNLSLNAAKISGACGRLMCCLRYEYDTYQEEMRRMPKLDTVVVTPDGIGTVTEVKPLQNTVKVLLENDSEKTPKLYHLSALKPHDKNTAVTPKKAEESVAPPSDDGQKEPRTNPKNRPRGNQNNNKHQKGQPASLKPEPTGQSEAITAESFDKGQGGEKGNAPRNAQNRHNRRNKSSQNRTDKSAPQSRAGTASPQSEAVPAAPVKTASQTPPQTPPKTPEALDGKRSYAPLPSNSIKRGTSGRFGGIKTRPQPFGKKDNSEKK